MPKQSNIEQLIHDMCPSGIEYKMLGEIATRNKGANITAGKMKAIADPNGDVRIFAAGNTVVDVSGKDIPQANIIRKPSIIVKSRGYVSFEYYDAPFTHKNEMWSYSNFVNANIKYVFYYLEQHAAYFQAIAKANSVKLPQLCVGDTDNYRIPLPPIEIQDEIVQKLDAILALILNIDNEIEERQHQYNIASAQYLNSANHNWPKDTLHNLGKFYSGLSDKSKDDFSDGNAKFVTYKNIYFNPALDLDIKDFVKVSPNEKQNSIQYGDVLFTGSSETPDECAISSVVNKQVKEKIYLNSFCFGFRFNDLSGIFIDFYKHYFRSSEIRGYALKSSHGTTRFNVSKAEFEEIPIPLPSLKEQQAIAAKLDTIEAFIANLQEERALRQQQYEYYREYLINLLK